MSTSPAAASAFVGFGSNMGDSRALVRAAGLALAALPGTQVLARSGLYQTAPVGRTDQQDFVNAVCRIATTLAPQALLESLLGIERMQGRVRGDMRGGPRTLDLDLLLYGDLACRSEQLELPHPRLHTRAFVLVPLAELNPEMVVPGRGPVRDLVAACRDQRIARLEEW